MQCGIISLPYSQVIESFVQYNTLVKQKRNFIVYMGLFMQCMRKKIQNPKGSFYV